jgi:nitrogen fixation protein FixH
MNDLVISIGIVILLEFIAFSLLYRFTRWSGKQVAFVIIVLTIGLYLPLGIRYWDGLDRFAMHVAFYTVIPYLLGIITTHWEIRRRLGEAESRQWFHWGPAIIVGFFLLIAVVDATIITLAEKGMSGSMMARIFPGEHDGSGESRFPGTVSHDFQEKEALYNEYLHKRQKQEERGWQIRKGWVGASIAGEPSVFKIAVTDRNGVPVNSADVQGQFLRPANSDLDQTFQMQEIDKGVYQVIVTLAEPGLWKLHLIIHRGDDWHEVRASTSIKPAS